MGLLQPANTINHIGFVIDMSYSMYPYATSLVQVMDNQTEHLGRRSKELDQETRASVYTFASRGTTKCVFFDKDVLRLPSLKGNYKAEGNTALIDATLKVIEDLEKTAQMYGDHSFLIYVLTDGEENSSLNRSPVLKAKLDSLPENWTVAIFVPNAYGMSEAKRFGFPAANIAVWNPSDKGVEEFGEIVRNTTDTYMSLRSTGLKGSKSLFTMNTVNTADIKSKLVPMTVNSYTVFSVFSKERIDEFSARETNRPYKLGHGYYELMKPEDVQGNKQIIIEYKGKFYGGPQARQLLGLPDHTVRVNPGNDSYKEYRIFVQSTAHNRNLIGGTRYLYVW